MLIPNCDLGLHPPPAAVTSAEQYLADLQRCGFVDLHVEDLSAPWTAWTRARHELYLAAEEETVAMHGRTLFEDRVAFYRAIDELFAGGNLGGVRITGRRPTEHEAALSRGRRALQASAAAAPSVQVIEGSGNTMVTPSVDAMERRAQELSVSAQPVFPASADAPFHDSLQYHFFFPGLFFATRVFHTASLQHHSSWLCSLNDHSPKAVELHNSATPLVQSNTDRGLRLHGEEMEVIDAPSGATLRFRPASASAIELLRGAGVPDGPDGRPVLEISFKTRHALSWMPASQESAGNAVIHRPDLDSAITWNGVQLRGYGYSKRYYGDYPKHWGYRFIHGVGDPTSSAPSLASAPCPGEQPTTVVWNADATFGDHKYNYFKMFPNAAADTPLVESATEDTWQQGDAGYAFIDGVKHVVQLRPVCSWATTIADAQQNTNSRMENRLCEMELRCGNAPPIFGLAYNERCYGTIG